MVPRYSGVNPPASAEMINETIRLLEVDEDVWIARFWALYNGALLDDQLLIYSTEEIVERNKTYDIDKDFPGQLLVGDDSGGRLVLIDRSVEDKFYLIGSGDPFLDDAEIFFSVEALVAYVLEDGNELPDSVSILAIGKAKATLQEILEIKKGLGLNDSVKDLKEKLKKENEVVLKEVKAAKYEGVLARYRHLIRFDN
ncbi:MULTISPECIES: SMI1/KNR4 family protein [unclassified Pseudomonas]|uniref:SMI1/KNR4 family protein n=1 Tax=unclassified Pseudomonas TaxID=196821 RepID=UPI000AB86E64|nr:MULTISPECIES: SMI1/KNR4 family protein [unclassified Pseudomonas]